MANSTRICAKLKSGIDISCERPITRFIQELCLMNFSDINQSSIVAPWTNTDLAECEYKGSFELLPNTKGYKFIFPERGGSVFGTVDTSVDDSGYPIFTHHVNALMTSSSPEDKCILDALSRGLVVGALKWSDGSVEIYGLRYGMSLSDMTIDPANNGGVSAIILSSLDISPESHLPINYEPAAGGSASADFDACFENEEE